MISSAGAVCFGETTDTAVRATCAVSAFRALRALIRDQMPDINRAITRINAMAMPNHLFMGRRDCPASFNGNVCATTCVLSSFLENIMTPHGFVPSAGTRFVPDAEVNPAER